MQNFQNNLMLKYPQEIGRYLTMYYIRAAEEGIVKRYSDQEMRCPVHLSIGQEAAAVGTCTTLFDTDTIYSTHRCHAHYLAKGGDLTRMLLEIYGKDGGCVGGRGGSMHLMDMSVGMQASVPIVGSSIPLSVGEALAFQQRGENKISAAFFGDGCMEEGVFHESANFAALRKLPVAFICENNLYSVYTRLSERQPNRPLSQLAACHNIKTYHVDGNDVEAIAKTMVEACEYMRTGQGPVFLEMPTYRWREHCGPAFDDHLNYRPEEEVDNWLERDPIKNTRKQLVEQEHITEDTLNAEEKNILTYVNKCFDIARAATLAKHEDAVKHVYAPEVITKSPTLSDFPISTRIINQGDAIKEALHGAVENNPSVFLMGEGIDDPSSMWGTAKGIADKFGADRVVEMPVAELGLTGVAIGAALAGRRPIINLQRVEFSLLALEQIVNNAAKAYYGSNGQHKVPMLIRMVIGRGWGQGPQHAQSLESMFAHFPGLKVIMPCMPADTKGMIAAAIEDDNPVICLEHRWLHYATEPVPEEYYVSPLDGPAILRQGNDITIVATSFMCLEALRAAEELGKIGISAEVIDLRVIRPLDDTKIIKSVKKTGRLLTIDTGWMDFGVGSEITARVSRKAFSALKMAPVQLAIPDHPVPSSRGLIPGYYPDSVQILNKIASILNIDVEQIEKLIQNIEDTRQDLPIDIPDPSFKGPF